MESSLAPLGAVESGRQPLGGAAALALGGLAVRGGRVAQAGGPLGPGGTGVRGVSGVGDMLERGEGFCS